MSSLSTTKAPCTFISEFSQYRKHQKCRNSVKTRSRFLRTFLSVQEGNQFRKDFLRFVYFLRTASRHFPMRFRTSNLDTYRWRSIRRFDDGFLRLTVIIVLLLMNYYNEQFVTTLSQWLETPQGLKDFFIASSKR